MKWVELGFHYKEGWFFKRLSDGSVRIVKLAEPKEDSAVTSSIVVDAESWGSIVSSVSSTGETGERQAKAVEFHNS